MDNHSRVWVAGHRGLVGSAMTRALTSQGYTNLLLRTRAELNLLDAVAVRTFVEQQHPEYVFLAAARVFLQLPERSDDQRTGLMYLCGTSGGRSLDERSVQPIPRPPPEWPHVAKRSTPRMSRRSATSVAALANERPGKALEPP